MDVPDPAVLDEGRGDEQAVVGRLLDEADDDRDVARRPGELGQPRVVEPHRDLGREVLEEVAGQPELREDGQADALAPRVGDERVVAFQVRLEVAEAGRDLGEADAESLHVPSLARRRVLPADRRGPPRPAERSRRRRPGSRGRFAVGVLGAWAPGA